MRNLPVCWHPSITTRYAHSATIAVVAVFFCSCLPLARAYLNERIDLDTPNLQVCMVRMWKHLQPHKWLTAVRAKNAYSLFFWLSLAFWNCKHYRDPATPPDEVDVSAEGCLLAIIHLGKVILQDAAAELMAEVADLLHSLARNRNRV